MKIKLTEFMYRVCINSINLSLTELSLKLIAIISFVFFLAFRPLVPVVEYVLNYDQIVKEFCINREKQEMMCKGKCYLFDELAQTSDESSSDGISSPTVKIQEIYVFSESLILEPIFSEISNTNSTTHYFENLKESTFSASIFHPPVFNS